MPPGRGNVHLRVKIPQDVLDALKIRSGFYDLSVEGYIKKLMEDDVAKHGIDLSVLRQLLMEKQGEDHGANPGGPERFPSSEWDDEEE